ncbi:hypothetical protein ANN_22111 [Periplaneta americana]|uniref:Uncharacterized protein n=1 Tax=Periplaneta americana TaxID=6978 RepID=A0ABQ8S872_PERAM|nr:hypothetical protein ANN_22111 [Periplaneta americana]
MDLREVGYDDRDWINLAQDRDRWRAYIVFVHIDLDNRDYEKRVCLISNQNGFFSNYPFDTNFCLSQIVFVHIDLDNGDPEKRFAGEVWWTVDAECLGSTLGENGCGTAIESWGFCLAVICDEGSAVVGTRSGIVFNYVWKRDRAVECLSCVMMVA